MTTTAVANSQQNGFSRKGFEEVYPFQSHFVEISGYQMHYIDEGKGDVILMLHGNPTWSFYYRRLIDHFRANYRVVVPDHIGYGFSDKPQKYSYSVPNQVPKVEVFVEKMGLKNITLVMHDWGGAYGMGYAVRHPENIKRLIFLNTGAFRIPQEILAKPPWELMIVRKSLLGPILVRGFNMFAKFAFSWFANAPIKNKLRRTKEARAGYLAPYNSWNNRIAVLGAVRDIPMKDDLPTYKELYHIEQNLNLFKDVPKIFLWGLKDFVFTEFVLNKWLEIYPGAEARKYADAGHYVLEDAYERIIPEMEQFLNKHPIK